MMRRERFNDLLALLVWTLVLGLPCFGTAPDEADQAFSEFDLTHPFDGRAQSRAVDSLIQSLGCDPHGYERIPISGERVHELFERAGLIKAVRGDSTGDPRPRIQAIHTRQIPNRLIRLGLARLFLRAPTPDVLDFFVRDSISLQRSGERSSSPVLWVGEPFCVTVDVYYSEVVQLLANSEAVTIPMLLDSLSRIGPIQRKDNRVAMAHVLFERYKKQGGLTRSQIAILVDKNLGVDHPPLAVASVIEEMGRIVSGQYFYVAPDKASKMALEKGLAWSGEVTILDDPSH